MKTVNQTIRTLPEMKSAAEAGEISRSAYERALGSVADANTDHDWWDCTIDTWKSALAEIGFLDADIRFTGFHSQGDGAVFYSNSTHSGRIIGFLSNPPAPENCIGVKDGREVFAPWVAHKIHPAPRCDYSHLVRYADNGDIEIRVSSIGSSRYRHENTATVHVDIHVDEDIDELKSLECAANGGATDWDGIERELASWIDRLRIDICNAIYRDLREEYDYLCGEEAAMECAEANGWHYDERGNTILR
jgi:hypothetical protein